MLQFRMLKWHTPKHSCTKRENHVSISSCHGGYGHNQNPSSDPQSPQDNDTFHWYFLCQWYPIFTHSQPDHLLQHSHSSDSLKSWTNLRCLRLFTSHTPWSQPSGDLPHSYHCWISYQAQQSSTLQVQTSMSPALSRQDQFNTPFCSNLSKKQWQCTWFFMSLSSLTNSLQKEVFPTSTSV